MNNEDFRAMYKSIHDQDFPVDGIPHGFIEPKNTDIGIILHCECGHDGYYGEVNNPFSSPTSTPKENPQSED
jgi:hypothetical protein